MQSEQLKESKVIFYQRNLKDALSEKHEGKLTKPTKKSHKESEDFIACSLNNKEENPQKLCY